MSLFQLFEFTFKFSLSESETATWIYVLLTLILVILIIGWGWGKMWNKEWSLGGHLGSLVLVITFGLLSAYSVFNLRGISRMEDWFQLQRTTLARSIADSSRLQRSALLSTWDGLSAKGTQQGLTPPVEGGNQLRLTNPEDAFSLAANAAIEARRSLSSKAPFTLGLPISTASPSEIATEAVDSIRFEAARYPTVVSESNEWAKTAATLQANHALDSAYNSIKPGMQDLKTACISLLVVSLGIALVAIPMNALGDIKINPKAK